MQDFRKLAVWTRAHAFALRIRECADEFPRSGYAELKAQIVRAAESIPSNIVEGCGAATRKEFARYLDISMKSTSEAEYQLQLGFDQGVIPHRTWAELTDEVVEIRKMLYGLRRAILAADARDKPRRRHRKDRPKRTPRGKRNGPDETDARDKRTEN